MNTIDIDEFRSAVEDADGTFPQSWIPDPGDMIVGRLERYDQATTAYGESDIVVVADEGADGELKSFWLLHTVAIQEFAKLQPQPGERIAIKRLVDGRTENAGGRASNYRRYIVRVDREASPGAVPNFQRHLPPEAGVAGITQEEGARKVVGTEEMGEPAWLTEGQGDGPGGDLWASGPKEPDLPYTDPGDQ